MSEMNPSEKPAVDAELPVRFDASGLVPVVVQDHVTGEIRMFAYANREALQLTLETGRATFWSRSRGEIWEKGRTSGNAIHVVRILVDCDADCVVYCSEPLGNSCHTGARSCFFQIVQPGVLSVPAEPPPQTALAALEAVLWARKRSTATASYTKSLYDAGAGKIGAKISEEARELSEAIAGETDTRVVSEAADTLYHLMVGLAWRGVALRDVLEELSSRFGRSGHEEKASR